MNTTATATTSAATCKPGKATPGKRRMARQPSERVTSGEGSSADTPRQSQSTARATSKIASVIALLKRAEGATLAEMVEATSWLPHTTRAALTGLKKNGHTITKEKRDDVTCYRIAKAG